MAKFLLPFFVSALGLVGTPAANAQTWQSATPLPTSPSGPCSVSQLITDGAGGYLLAGNFTGTLTLGSFVLTSAGNQDLFVARLSATGQWTQAVRAGGAGNDNAAGLVLDGAGLVTVAGSFASPTITFGATTLTNADASTDPTTDLFVARLNAAGQWTQAVRAGGDNIDTADQIALDPNGTVVIGGTFFNNTLKLGSYTLPNNVAAGAPFVARLSSTGTWSQAVALQSSGGPVYLGALAVDSNGTVVVSGTVFLGSTLTFGSYTLPRSTGNTLFVARLNRSGTWVQAVQAGGPDGTTLPRRLVLDAANNVVVAGESTASSASFGSYAVTSPHDASGQGSYICYVARLSAAGTWTQVAQVSLNPGSPPNSYQSSYVMALALDASGNVWLGGVFDSSSITLGGITLANSDPKSLQNILFDGYVARLSSAGAWTFALPAGSAAPTALVPGGSRLVVAGNMRATTSTFGALTITAAATPTGFVAGLGGGVLAAVSSTTLPLTCAVSPNPATHYTTLTLPAAAEARPVQLLDVLGREVRRFALPAQAGSLALDLTGLPGGSYVVRCGASAGRLVME